MTNPKINSLLTINIERFFSGSFTSKLNLISYFFLYSKIKPASSWEFLAFELLKILINECLTKREVENSFRMGWILISFNKMNLFDFGNIEELLLDLENRGMQLNAHNEDQLDNNVLFGRLIYYLERNEITDSKSNTQSKIEHIFRVLKSRSLNEKDKGKLLLFIKCSSLKKSVMINIMNSLIEHHGMHQRQVSNAIRKKFQDILKESRFTDENVKDNELMKIKETLSFNYLFLEYGLMDISLKRQTRSYIETICSHIFTGINNGSFADKLFFLNEIAIQSILLDGRLRRNWLKFFLINNTFNDTYAKLLNEK